MRMLRGKLFVGVVASLLATACVGFASWGFHKSSDRATNVTFINMTKFKTGQTLPAGTYRMEVPQNSQSPHVTFEKDGKVMATVLARMIAQTKKYSDTEIDSVKNGKAQLVTAIRPEGWNQELIFSHAKNASSHTKP